MEATTTTKSTSSLSFLVATATPDFYHGVVCFEIITDSYRLIFDSCHDADWSSIIHEFQVWNPNTRNFENGLIADWLKKVCQNRINDALKETEDCEWCDEPTSKVDLYANKCPACNNRNANWDHLVAAS